MKANFDYCLDVVLSHEGGFVNHPKDPGGMTNFGVTRSVYESHIGRMVSEEEMQAITPLDVRPIYLDRYWHKVKADNLPIGVDLVVFDWSVNSGVNRASKHLQKAVGVKEDGIIGPMTLLAVLEKNPRDIILSLKNIRQDFYESLSHFKTFGKGWTSRNEETTRLALELID
jgi:lysozyme family protein